MIGFTQLMQLMEVDCRATAPSGIGYKLIVVPELRAVYRGVVEKLLELVDGVRHPLVCPGRAARPGGNIFNSTTPIALTNLDIQPDLTLTPKLNDAAIYFVHRVIDGADIYSVMNALRKSVDVVISVRALPLSLHQTPLEH
ncbi:uncharacterized protein ARMOST_09850 [Armillaria ostoyae]|uniref:Uncharacterized protein n=1 Tax=Armillaria ostoyae TaxID=47428 RepID=A0A284RCM8_ARMOS|nr:uncharacterized protein ARMOST_09850 [Armillaria ostoyae]